MTGGIAAVQARMVELSQLLAPTATTSTTTTTSTGTSFADALASVTGTTEATTSIAPGSGVTGEALVAAATKYLGTPYVWGGESLEEGGLDCSGLVQRSLADLGITDVPRVARDQMTLGTEVASLAEARAGDLVVFGGGTHIGIYVGDGKMIDAPKPGQSVTIRDVYTEPTTIRRILPSAAEVASTGASTTLASALASSSAGQSALSLLDSSSSTASLSSLLGSSTSGLSSASLSSLLQGVSA
jgi:cell wall-associated NlpC family hydrolase